MRIPGWLRTNFKKGDPIRIVADSRQQNRIANILTHIQGVGCRIIKDTTQEGRGWFIIVDGSSDVDLPGAGGILPPEESAGEYHGQVKWWDDINSEWKLTTAPTSPAVLVFDKAVDATNGTVRWQTIDTDYKGIYRGSDDNITDDWVRAHG